MSDNSKIEWTDATWNPMVGCEDVSPGCANCYAKRSIWRLQHNPNPKIAAANAGLTKRLSNGRIGWTGAVNCLPDRLDAPLHWKKPKKIFVNSQSDLFHKDVPDAFIDDVFATMTEAHWHTYQVLTKRPERMAHYMNSRTGKWYRGYPQSVWLGTSVENQETADERIPWLLQTPAVLRFLSCEPLLGPLKLFQYLNWPKCTCDGEYAPCEECDALGPRTDIGWCIVGGESGPGARPAHPDWYRSLRDQCQNADVPFFFKQHGLSLAESQFASFSTDRAIQDCFKRSYDMYEGGKRSFLAHGERFYPMSKEDSGHLLDGVEHFNWPESLAA